jgi:hypothetical protein
MSRGSRPSPRLLSEHVRSTDGFPETVQSRSGHVSGGTLSAAVVTNNPARTVRAVRVRRAASAYAIVRTTGYAAFRIAPVGTTPLVTYRHKTITNLRASATIPMRRARLPAPKRARYHSVRALAGCQRTQFHAN